MKEELLELLVRFKVAEQRFRFRYMEIFYDFKCRCGKIHRAGHKYYWLRETFHDFGNPRDWKTAELIFCKEAFEDYMTEYEQKLRESIKERD